MPTSYSDLLRLAKQATGENDTTWGDIMNENTIELLEDAIAKVEDISVTAGNVTLSTNNGTADQARAAVLSFSGAPATTRTVTIPTSDKIYWLHNRTSDSSSVIVTTGSGDTKTLAGGEVSVIYCDGTEVFPLDFLSASNNLSDVNDAATSRTNLGLGDMATKTVGTGFEIVGSTISVGGTGENFGDVKMSAATTVPTGWLECTGAAVSRTTYSDLFTAIGESFGAGDGSTTFNLPDFRGRSPLGLGQGLTGEGDTTGTSRGMGDTVGYEEHSLTSAENAPHTHDAGTLQTDSAGAHTHTGGLQNVANGGNIAPLSNSSWQGDTASTDSAGAHNHTLSGTTASSGSGDGHNNMHPSIALRFIIYTGV